MGKFKNKLWVLISLTVVLISASAVSAVAAGKYYWDPAKGYSQSIPMASLYLKKEYTAAYAVAKVTKTADIVNLDYVSKKVGISKEDAAKRINRMFDEKLIRLTADSPVDARGFGLYYCAVKLKKSATPKQKEQLSNVMQNEDHVCTGYEVAGDFDFVPAFHVTTLEMTEKYVRSHFDKTGLVESYQLLPVQRILRQERINHWGAPVSMWNKVVYAPQEMEKLAKIQNKLDLTDLKIIQAMMENRPAKDYYNWDYIAKKTGLQKNALIKGLETAWAERMFVLPVYMNWMKLGYTNHLFLVKIDRKVNSAEKIAIGDQLAQNDSFNMVMQFNDCEFSYMLGAWTKITDIDALRKEIKGIKGVELVKEVDMTRQWRQWTCRLDDKNWDYCKYCTD